MEFDQIYNHLITKRRIFVGKDHACNKMFKLNVKYNKASTSLAPNNGIWSNI